MTSDCRRLSFGVGIKLRANLTELWQFPEPPQETITICSEAFV